MHTAFPADQGLHASSFSEFNFFPRITQCPLRFVCSNLDWRLYLILECFYFVRNLNVKEKKKGLLKGTSKRDFETVTQRKKSLLPVLIQCMEKESLKK